MPFNVRAAGVWQAVAKVHARVAGAWVVADQVWGYAAGGWRSAWQNEIRYINTSARTEASIFELMGSPTQAGDYIFENQAEISAGTGSYALRTGVFPAGSTLHIINKSTIQGKGGAGGAATHNTSYVGGAGGTALYIDYPCTVDNSAGYIWGGGGGGGGAVNTGANDGEGTSSDQVFSAAGGGAGRNGGAAGSGGSATRVQQQGAGTASAGGQYGRWRSSWNTNIWAQGGAGGGPGAAGDSGSLGPAWAFSHYRSTKAGGAAGAAIAKNGKAVTITAGNDTTRIKGAVA